MVLSITIVSPTPEVIAKEPCQAELARRQMNEKANTVNLRVIPTARLSKSRSYTRSASHLILKNGTVILTTRGKHVKKSEWQPWLLKKSNARERERGLPPWIKIKRESNRPSEREKEEDSSDYSWALPRRSFVLAAEHRVPTATSSRLSAPAELSVVSEAYRSESRVKGREALAFVRAPTTQLSSNLLYSLALLSHVG